MGHVGKRILWGLYFAFIGALCVSAIVGVALTLFGGR
jgi:hypothetical protein